MARGAGSGLVWVSSMVLKLFLHLFLYHFLICVKIGVFIFIFPRHFVCSVTASVAVLGIGLTTFPRLFQELLRAE